MYIDIYFLD